MVGACCQEGSCEGGIPIERFLASEADVSAGGCTVRGVRPAREAQPAVRALPPRLGHAAPTTGAASGGTPGRHDRDQPPRREVQYTHAVAATASAKHGQACFSADSSRIPNSNLSNTHPSLIVFCQLRRPDTRAIVGRGLAIAAEPSGIGVAVSAVGSTRKRSQPTRPSSPIGGRACRLWRPAGKCSHQRPC